MNKNILLLGLGMILIFAGCSRERTDRAGNRSYVITLGQDTVAVETFSRSRQAIEGKTLQRIPVTRLGTYRADIADDGTISSLEVRWRTPEQNPEGPPPAGYQITIDDSVATISRWGTWRGNEIDTTYQRVVPEGTIPMVNVSPFALSLFEQAVRQAEFGTGDSTKELHTIHPLRRGASSIKVSQKGEDTYSWIVFGSPVIGEFNDDLQLTSFSAEATTMDFVSSGPTEVDFNQLVGRYASRDAAGEGIGTMSPRDQVEAIVDGAEIKIDYSRPSMRGRLIWGGLVPYGQVWRTGANAATQFQTSKDLMIGDTELPAGTYTLFSIHEEDGSQLIINEQTGQWGTQYNAENDFVRIPMERVTLEEPTERFTISISDTGEGGMLHFEWDQTRFNLPFTVAG